MSTKFCGMDGPLSVIDGSTAAAEWSAPQRLDIGSIAVDQYSETALVDEVLHHALFGRTARQLVTANAQFYVLAQKSRRFRECLHDADYICADGMPIVWACNSLYGGRVRRIAGVALIEELLAWVLQSRSFSFTITSALCGYRLQLASEGVSKSFPEG